MSPVPKLSVVVGTYNRLPDLRRCVESIFDQTTTPVCVYITDAGSTDGTIEYLESIASESIVPIFVGELVGQAKAYNDVFRLVDTPYVCWLSDDDEVANGGLDVAVRILDKRRSIGMLALKVDDASRPEGKKPRYSGGISPIGVLNVNQGMLRTRVLNEVGGFSEWLRDFCIDTDLTAKVLFSGYKIAFTKRIALHHHAEPATAENRARRTERIRLPAQRCDAKWRPYQHESFSWSMKRRVWRRFQRVLFNVFKMDRNTPHAVLGLGFFDWRNILMGRYISVLDPLRCLGRSYHLVQHCPRRLQVKALPVDPPAGEEDRFTPVKAVPLTAAHRADQA